MPGGTIIRFKNYYLNCMWVMSHQAQSYIFIPYALRNACSKYQASSFNSLQDMVKTSFSMYRWRHLDWEVVSPGVQTESFYFLCLKEYLF